MPVTQTAGTVYNGTNPALDNTNTAPVVGGLTLPSNMDFVGTARSGNELIAQIDALIVKAGSADSFTTEDKATWQSLMRQLGQALEHTSIEGFRGKVNGSDNPEATSIAKQLSDAFLK